jgi:hypothetical protein
MLKKKKERRKTNDVYTHRHTHTSIEIFIATDTHRDLSGEIYSLRGRTKSNETMTAKEEP